MAAPPVPPQVIELCRPLDSRLEHVDFESLFSSLSVRHLLCVFASLLLERRVIFIADKLRYQPWQLLLKCLNDSQWRTVRSVWGRGLPATAGDTPLREECRPVGSEDGRLIRHTGSVKPRKPVLLCATYMIAASLPSSRGVLGALLCAEGTRVKAQSCTHSFQSGRGGGAVRSSEQSPGTMPAGLTRAVHSRHLGGHSSSEKASSGGVLRLRASGKHIPG